MGARLDFANTRPAIVFPSCTANRDQGDRPCPCPDACWLTADRKEDAAWGRRMRERAWNIVEGLALVAGLTSAAFAAMGGFK